MRHDGKVETYKIQLELCCEMHHSDAIDTTMSILTGSDSTNDRSLAAHQRRIVNLSYMHRSRRVQILSHSIIITISLHSIYKTSEHCTGAIVNHHYHSIFYSYHQNIVSATSVTHALPGHVYKTIEYVLEIYRFDVSSRSTLLTKCACIRTHARQ